MLPKILTLTRRGAYPRDTEHIPTGSFQQGRFRARFARTESELDDILRLRFQIFNIELAEGLDSSWDMRRDVDEFDAQCHHLLVEEIGSGAVVGTYRLQTAEMARAAGGFYSAGEYELEQMPESVLSQAVEIGRACVHREWRNRQILFLLWRCLAQYLMHNNKRYFFGCSSLTSQDPDEGWRLHRQLRAAGYVHPQLMISSKPHTRCIETTGHPVSGVNDESSESHPPVAVPTLFGTYLRYNSLVCSEPAIDREFKTIDYLLLFDRQAASEKTLRLFFR